METVISLQHPTARSRHSVEAVLPSRRVLGAGGERDATAGIPAGDCGERRCPVPLGLPPHHLQGTVPSPAGRLGISPFFRQPLISLNLFSRPV